MMAEEILNLWKRAMSASNGKYLVKHKKNFLIFKYLYKIIDFTVKTTTYCGVYYIYRIKMSY